MVPSRAPEARNRTILTYDRSVGPACFTAVESNVQAMQFLTRNYYRNGLQYLELARQAPSGEFEFQRHTPDPLGGPYEQWVTETDLRRMSDENGVPWDVVSGRGA
jgi:hypothetical protein